MSSLMLSSGSAVHRMLCVRSRLQSDHADEFKISLCSPANQVSSQTLMPISVCRRASCGAARRQLQASCTALMGPAARWALCKDVLFSLDGESSVVWFSTHSVRQTPTRVTSLIRVQRTVPGVALPATNIYGAASWETAFTHPECFQRGRDNKSLLLSGHFLIILHA